MSMEPKILRSKDWVSFHCRRCGDCCRNVADQIMLEPLDAYHLGQYLRKRGAIQFIEEVYERYTHPSLLEDIFPIFLLNTSGPEQSCVFLKDGRCSVYGAHPRVCRVYPFFVYPGERGKIFECRQCMDLHSAHFSGGKVLVKDWLYQNLTKENRAFLTAEGSTLLEQGRLLHALDRAGREADLFHTLYYCYYNYDLDVPFMPQYEQNMAALKGILQGSTGRGTS